MVDLGLVWSEVLASCRIANDGSRGSSQPARDKSRILRTQENGLHRQCQAIVKNIGDLRRFLLEQRSAYMMTSSGLAGAMSELDRNQVDATSDETSVRCRALISAFRDNVNKSKASGTAKEHYLLVADGLDQYLKKTVCVHSEMRAVRLQKQLELNRLSKLEINSRESRSEEIGGVGTKLSAAELREKAANTAAAVKQNPMWESSDEDEQLSPAEAQLLEQENERLLEQLNSLNNAVDQVTSKVVKISELQEIFSEKVLQQSADIETIHAQAVTSTENIKGGNEAVREAIQNKASYRVMILFILLVFSFSLLFLDWYNE